MSSDDCGRPDSLPCHSSRNGYWTPHLWRSSEPIHSRPTQPELFAATQGVRAGTGEEGSVPSPGRLSSHSRRRQMVRVVLGPAADEKVWPLPYASSSSRWARAGGGACRGFARECPWPASGYSGLSSLPAPIESRDDPVVGTGIRRHRLGMNPLRERTLVGTSTAPVGSQLTVAARLRPSMETTSPALVAVMATPASSGKTDWR
jgi:hypothetical protein